jgi:hypothetical protein
MQRPSTGSRRTLAGFALIAGVMLASSFARVLRIDAERALGDTRVTFLGVCSFYVVAAFALWRMHCASRSLPPDHRA